MKVSIDSLSNGNHIKHLYVTINTKRSFVWSILRLLNAFLSPNLNTYPVITNKKLGYSVVYIRGKREREGGGGKTALVNMYER